MKTLISMRSALRVHLPVLSAAHHQLSLAVFSRAPLLLAVSGKDTCTRTCTGVVLQILVHYLVHYKDQVLRHYDGNSRRTQEREWRRDVRAFSRLMQGPNALEENVHRLEMRWGDPARHGPILAAALGRPIVYIGISFWQSQKRASAGLGMTQHSLQRFSGTSSANATTQDLLPILALTPSVGVKDLAATALRNCEQDTIFLLHGWDAQHYNLVDTRPPMAPQ